MPQYEAELSDGRVVTVEADKPPSEADILSAVKSYKPAPVGPKKNALGDTRESLALEKEDLQNQARGGRLAEQLFSGGEKLGNKLGEIIRNPMTIPDLVLRAGTGATADNPNLPSKIPLFTPGETEATIAPVVRPLMRTILPETTDPMQKEKQIQAVQERAGEIGSQMTTAPAVGALATGKPGMVGFGAASAATVPETISRIRDAANKGDEVGVLKAAVDLTAQAGAIYGGAKAGLEARAPTETPTPITQDQNVTEPSNAQVESKPVEAPPNIPSGKEINAIPMPVDKGSGWKTSPDWKRAFDEAPDLEEKVDWLRAVANNRGGRKATSDDMLAVLRRTEDLIAENPEHSRLANALYDISINPESSQEVKARAKSLYEASPTGPPPKVENVTTPVTQAKPAGQGLAKEVRAKWSSATDTGLNLGSEAGFLNIEPLRELYEKGSVWVRGAVDAVMAAGKEQMNVQKMNDYRKAVLNWSAKMQKSFGESNAAQKEIRSTVTDPVKREGITNWIQAGGDVAVLQSRLAATTDPKLKKGYEAALKLTPEEISVANEIKQTYDALGKRGSLYDILKSFKDNYVTQVWDLGRSAPTGGSSSRTLKQQFRFAKTSSFDTFFDGEQAGFKPKTKDISDLLPMYIHEMNNVIAARQLVEEMSKGKASDGRPLVAPKGIGIPVEGDEGKATLIAPKAVKGEDTADYKVLPNQPALTDWRWASKDSAGNPVFLKSDLALHPEAFNRLKQVLGRSKIREWYSTPTSDSMVIPKALVKGLDLAQSEVKRTMLGLLAPFHQVQEGTHAVGHRVSPFWNVPEIDLVKNTAQMDAAKHGLMLLPDRISAEQFMEGFKVSGAVGQHGILGKIIPGYKQTIGKAADWYSHYLFQEYIPGLKFKTYEAMLERNTKVYAEDLKAGKISSADIKSLSASQANAAYGHLNYADLSRDPTFQHLLQNGLLAPDFLEARGRFAIQALKGLTGAKVGREQILAVATLAAGQMIAAYTMAKLAGGDWDVKRPFEFRVGNRSYTLRSVPEDIHRLITRTREFIYNRLNPTTTKTAIQMLSGVDWRGQKVTTKETMQELAKQPVPLMLRGILGLDHTPLSWWEQTLGSMGIKISRYSPSTDVHSLVSEFKKNSADPKLQAEYKREQHTTNPESDYKPLRDALSKNDLSSARKEYEKLLQSKKPDVILNTMRPFTVSEIPGTQHQAYEQHPKPFTGSAKYERQFVKTLTTEEKALYDKALKERKDNYERFRAMLKTRKKPTAQ